MNYINPKYLTPELAEKAVDIALELLFGTASDSILNGETYCIFILVPAVDDVGKVDYSEWKDYPAKAYLLYRRSVVNTVNLEYLLSITTRCTDFQLRTSQHGNKPDPKNYHLLPGETPYWDGVRRKGIAAICSGINPWLDKAIPVQIIDTLVELAQNAYEEDIKK